MRLLVGADVPLHHGQLLLVQVPPTRRSYFFVCTLVSGYILQDCEGRSVVLGMIPVVIEVIDDG